MNEMQQKSQSAEHCPEYYQDKPVAWALNILFEERKKADKDFTLQSIADSVGKSRQAVSHWITGTRKPKADMLQKLADYFNVSVEFITTGGKTPRTPNFEIKAMVEFTGISDAAIMQLHNRNRFAGPKASIKVLNELLQTSAFYSWLDTFVEGERRAEKLRIEVENAEKLGDTAWDDEALYSALDSAKEAFEVVAYRNSRAGEKLMNDALNYDELHERAENALNSLLGNMEK